MNGGHCRADLSELAEIIEPLCDGALHKHRRRGFPVGKEHTEVLH